MTISLQLESTLTIPSKRASTPSLCDADSAEGGGAFEGVRSVGVAFRAAQRDDREARNATRRTRRQN